jgi:hypothetical protein
MGCFGEVKSCSTRDIVSCALISHVHTQPSVKCPLLTSLCVSGFEDVGPIQRSSSLASDVLWLRRGCDRSESWLDILQELGENVFSPTWVPYPGLAPNKLWTGMHVQSDCLHIRLSEVPHRLDINVCSCDFSLCAE